MIVLVALDPKGGLSDRESLMSKLGWILGFRLPSYTIPKKVGGVNGTLTGEAIANASGIPYFYLIVDEFKNSNPHSFLGLSRTSQLSSQQILARITVDTSSFNAGVGSGPQARGGAIGYGPQIMAVGENGDNLDSDTRTYGELVDIQKNECKNCRSVWTNHEFQRIGFLLFIGIETRIIKLN